MAWNTLQVESVLDEAPLLEEFRYIIRLQNWFLANKK